MEGESAALLREIGLSNVGVQAQEGDKLLAESGDTPSRCQARRVSNRLNGVPVTKARVTGSPVIGKPSRGVLGRQWAG